MCFWQAVKITVCWYVQIARARIINLYYFIKYNILILIEIIGYWFSLWVTPTSHGKKTINMRRLLTIGCWLLAVSYWLSIDVMLNSVQHLSAERCWLCTSRRTVRSWNKFRMTVGYRRTLDEVFRTTYYVVCITFNLLTFNLSQTTGMSLATITEQRICHTFIPSLLMTGRRHNWWRNET